MRPHLPLANHQSTSLVIHDRLIRQDAEGRYCLNDLHRAAGGERRHGPAVWLANQQTQELVQELSDTEIPVSVVRGGREQGSYVVKELVYGYAMWISPRFHLKVIRAYDAAASGSLAPDLSQVLADPVAMRHALLGYADRLIEQAPKVAALDRIAAADGSACITDAAKTLGVAPRKMFAWLAEHRWIYRRGGAQWTAYQPRIEAGLLEHAITSFRAGDGEERVTSRTLVTAKGLAKLAELLAAEAAMTGGAR